MVGLAPMIEKETGIDLRIVGFDTGQGLPSVHGYKDHPELWRPGDFATEDREALMQKLGGRAEIIWGDIADTIGPFTDSINDAAPLGFISVDLDIYSATTAALQCLTGRPENYNPGISMYFDDVNSLFANEWAGELAAIAEFNENHELRKIGLDRQSTGTPTSNVDKLVFENVRLPRARSRSPPESSRPATIGNWRSRRVHGSEVSFLIETNIVPEMLAALCLAF